MRLKSHVRHDIFLSSWICTLTESQGVTTRSGLERLIKFTPTAAREVIKASTFARKSKENTIFGVRNPTT